MFAKEVEKERHPDGRVHLDSLTPGQVQGVCTRTGVSVDLAAFSRDLEFCAFVIPE